MTDVRIDSKGKYYTKIVSTQPLEVIARLRTGETVRGSVHIRANRRLSDILNDDDHFISITNAVVSRDGDESVHTAYVAIHRSALIWVIPAEAVGEEDED